MRQQRRTNGFAQRFGRPEQARRLWSRSRGESAKTSASRVATSRDGRRYLDFLQALESSAANL